MKPLSFSQSVGRHPGGIGRRIDSAPVWPGFTSSLLSFKMRKS